MSGDLPFVSVIIPVYRGSTVLRRCLSALRQQDYPANRFEIVIVFNDGTSSELPADSEQPLVRCYRENTPGSYAARNKGLEHARGDILAFTDIDCIPDPAWLRTGVHALLTNSGFAFVGGRIELVPNSSARLNPVEHYEKRIHFLQQIYVNQCRFAATANMFTKREIIERVGPFNANLKSGGDLDWGTRASSLGLKGLYEPDAIVRHPARTFGELLRKARRLAGGIVDRQRLNRRLSITGYRGFVSDFREEQAILRGNGSLLRPSNGFDAFQDLSLSLLSFLIFGVRVVERWRVRLGATSLRQ